MAEADLRAHFCAQTERFRWTDETWALGVEGDPANLRRAVQINSRRDQWCP